jgi:hypothetical protein
MWESGDFTGSSVPLIESLKSKAHLITDARKWKNLTHLQRVLLFKDSSEAAAQTNQGYGASSLCSEQCVRPHKLIRMAATLSPPPTTVNGTKGPRG